jgi:hypothetical protein
VQVNCFWVSGCLIWRNSNKLALKQLQAAEDDVIDLTGDDEELEEEKES